LVLKDIAVWSDIIKMFTYAAINFERAAKACSVDTHATYQA